jgi:hypothetical protein
MRAALICGTTQQRRQAHEHDSLSTVLGAAPNRPCLRRCANAASAASGRRREIQSGALQDRFGSSPRPRWNVGVTCVRCALRNFAGRTDGPARLGAGLAQFALDRLDDGRGIRADCSSGAQSRDRATRKVLPRRCGDSGYRLHSGCSLRTGGVYQRALRAGFRGNHGCGFSLAESASVPYLSHMLVARIAKLNRFYAREYYAEPLGLASR